MRKEPSLIATPSGGFLVFVQVGMHIMDRRLHR